MPANAALTSKGFLIHKNDTIDGFDGYPPILGVGEGYVPYDEDVFVVALGEPEYKIEYAQIISDRAGIRICCLSNSIHWENV